MAMAFPKTAYLAVQSVEYRDNPQGVVVWNRREFENIRSETVLNPSLIQWVDEEPKKRVIRRVVKRGDS